MVKSMQNPGNPEDKTDKTSGSPDLSDYYYFRIIDVIRDNRKIDLTQYKPTFIRRRISIRLRHTGTQTLDRYYKYLLSTPSEVDKLIDELTISVTNFFRDPDVWECLKSVVLPSIFAEKDATRRKNLLFWSAGCATGEEAYSLAILLHELLREDIARYKIRIFATDLDEIAIQRGKEGVYSSESIEGSVFMADLPLEKYFTTYDEEEGLMEVIPQLKSLVVFRKEDLFQTRTMLSVFDMILCRNLLIYIDRERHEEAFEILYRHLARKGFLVLGKNEFLTSQWKGMFEVVDLKCRIFRKR